MTERIREYIKQYHMIVSGDTVCVGLSGGADSVCLLLILLELYGGRNKEEVRICAVHVNHQLRGEEADGDEQFVRELCELHRVPLQVKRFPVAEIASQNGIGTEEAGRLVRHKAYRECLDSFGASVIALAHHANDRAETFLFHAARGSSLAGLAGIRAVQPFTYAGLKPEDKEMCRGASIIRPLLCVTRKEIESWLSGRGQSWRTDETNRDEAYTRNAIRHSGIPFLEKQVNEQAVRHIAEACADLEEADRYLKAEAIQRAGRYIQYLDQEIRISALLTEQPLILQGYILLDALERAGGSRKDLGREQVRQLQGLFGMQTGKRIDLPYGLYAVRDYEGIRLCRRKQIPGTEETIPVTGPGTYVWRSWQFHVRILENPGKDSPEGSVVSDDIIPRKKYTKWMDCDKIDGILCIRNRKQGDRIVVNTLGGSRKLKDYLIDEKVPREERDAIPLLASGQQIWWAVGYRISEAAKVTEQTRKILEITAVPATDPE